MTTAELEKEFHRLRVKVDVLESLLTSTTTLPILGAVKNWQDYQNTLRQALAKAGL